MLRTRRQQRVACFLLIVLAGCGAAPTASEPSDRAPGPPVSLTITPGSLRLFVGQGWMMVANPHDASGQRAPAEIDWSTSDSLVVAIRPDGVATARSLGQATITASIGNLTARAPVEVFTAGGSLLAFVRLTVAPGPPYVTTSDLHLVGLSSGVALVVPGSREIAITSPTLSPDGIHLAVTAVSGPVGEGAGYPGQGMRGFDGPSNLAMLPFLNAPSTLWIPLTHDGWSRLPDWSPDGKRIVYVSGRPDESHLYVLEPGAGLPKRLTETAGNYTTPRWSPDGKHLAFSMRVNGQEEVFLMEADGGPSVNLTRHAANDAYPSWSPDGDRLAFSSDRSGPYCDIYVLTLATGHLVRLTTQDPGISNEQPSWSPDGAQIAFSRIATEEAARPGIYLVSVDGISRVQVTATLDGFTDHFPAWTRQEVP